MLETKKAHSIEIEESAGSIFNILQDVTIWPDFFKPTLSAAQLEFDDNSEIIEIAALSNGLPHRWKSKRTHFSDEMKIQFEQVKSNPKIKMMKGEWVVQPLGHEKTKVFLNHEYIAENGCQGFVDSAVEHNSKTELAGLKTAVSQTLKSKDRYFRSTRNIVLNCPKDFVFDFLAYAKEWEDNIPHVVQCDVEDLGDGFQLFSLTTQSEEGDQFITKSYRSLDAASRSIDFKQSTFPPTIDLHNGKWEITDSGDGKTVVSITHSLLLSEKGIEAGYQIENVENYMHKHSETTLKICEKLYLNC